MAPRFDAWRRLDPERRVAHRADAGRVGSGVASALPYSHENYERQQPPLFYLAAAPSARLLAGASLPAFLVGLRLFCVLLGSLVVPLTARLARLLLPARGVFFALPVVALAPNTLFFLDRVTNDALAWPLLAATAGALVLAARRPGRPSGFVALGLLVAAGVWTKMTLLSTLPAALVAVLLARRRRDGRGLGRALAGVGLPALLCAPLLVWNAAASGDWSGVTYAVPGGRPGVLAALAELARVDLPFFLREWVRNHLWAGGWGFLRPPDAVYSFLAVLLLAAAAAAVLAARARGRAIFAGGRWTSLGALVLFFAASMLLHVLSAAAAGRALGGPPVAGGEGWYFDVLRPIEAAAAAAMLCAALPAGRTRAAAAALCGGLLAADAAGTFGLLLPRWAGLEAAGWSPAAIWQAASGSREAAPLLYPPWLALTLAAMLLAGAAAFCARAPAPREARAPTAG
jgi:hypothetical protein